MLKHIFHRISIYVIVGLALALLALPALAQTPQACMPEAAMVASWQAEFGEVPAVAGRVDNSDRVMIVVASPDRTWTMWMRRPDGTVCLVITGKDWTLATPPPSAPGKGT